MDTTIEAPRTPGPNDVPFTQYLLPDGRKRDEWIPRPPAIADAARKLRDRGVRFEIEILTTGDVSMTAERDDKDGETVVLAICVCANGPDVPGAVDKLIAGAEKNLSGMVLA